MRIQSEVTQHQNYNLSIHFLGHVGYVTRRHGRVIKPAIPDTKTAHSTDQLHGSENVQLPFESGRPRENTGTRVPPPHPPAACSHQTGGDYYLPGTPAGTYQAPQTPDFLPLALKRNHVQRDNKQHTHTLCRAQLQQGCVCRRERWNSFKAFRVHRLNALKELSCFIIPMIICSSWSVPRNVFCF